MAADLQSRQLITDLLEFANGGKTSQAKAAGMKTTLIAGYPVFASWAMWVGVRNK
jgi:hypothetical protein